MGEVLVEVLARRTRLGLQGRSYRSTVLSLSDTTDGPSEPAAALAALVEAVTRASSRTMTLGREGVVGSERIRAREGSRSQGLSKVVCRESGRERQRVVGKH